MLFIGVALDTCRALSASIVFFRRQGSSVFERLTCKAKRSTKSHKTIRTPPNVNLVYNAAVLERSPALERNR